MKFTKAIQLMQEWAFYKIKATNYFKTASNFIWYIDYTDKKEYINVPKDFVTDFGSIPQFLWWISNPTKYVSYVLHDYLYEVQGEWGKYTRKECDMIMLEALQVEWCNIISAYLKYLAVRLFWWQAWKKYK